MSVLDFDRLGAYVDVPKNARKLLERSEKEIQGSLTLRISEDRVILAPCYVVYHNLARGPAKGGIRMMPDVTMEHTRDLAELMTYKSALVGIPFGGGKSAIRIDGYSLSRFEKTALMREYCHMLHLELSSGAYIPAPDMGTRPEDMATIFGRFDRTEVVTGKPPRVGGLPGREEATGRGVAYCCELAARDLLDGSDGAPLKDKSVAVQGFGNVGRWTARFCAERGARVVAITDINGGVFDVEGLDIDRLWSLEGAQLGATNAGYRSISNDELFEIQVDLLVPAAMERQVTEKRAMTTNARVIVEGANGPVASEADSVLVERRIPVIPDILANAGGVIASYVEWRKAKSGSITDKSETYETIEQSLSRAYNTVRDFAREKNVDHRTAAQGVALHEVIETMRDRSWI